MWDIETFVVPVLSLLQRHAAESLLDYRLRSLPSAAGNARLRGRRGLQFPWESAPSGQEAAPLPGSPSWHAGDSLSQSTAVAQDKFAAVEGDVEARTKKNPWGAVAVAGLIALLIGKMS